MKPEQWQQAREVLADALELKPEDRPAFLDRVCSSDNSLRREVERLLASSGEAKSSFLESSALRVTLMPGAKLGEYEVQKLIGSGGMGEVYRARDTRLGRDVAIKVLPTFLSQDPDRLRRFEQEARAAAALNHSNILAVFQMGTYEGAPYLVSELLEGGTLREQLVRGPMPLRKAIDFGVQIARGLAAAHEKGIVHRDLKPENLFVTKDGRVKILDFGLAKLVQRPTTLDHSTVTASNGTEPGVVMGTVGYMSPEQVCGKDADHRADVFAFGAILYEMLAGKRAFQKPTSAETMSAILNEDPPGISQLAPNVPLALQRVVHRCLEKNPEQRFQSASDLAFALEALSDSSTSGAIVPERTQSRISWAKVPVLGLIAAFAVALFAWLQSPERPRVEAVRQLTDDSEVKPDDTTIDTDGSRVYFTEYYRAGSRLSQVAVSGGQVAPVPTQIRNPLNNGIAPDSSGLLVTEEGGSLLFQPLPAGAPRRLGNIASWDAIFTPDGAHIVYATLGTLYTADKDGGNVRKICDLPAVLGLPAISPDGKKIRVTADDASGYSLWEVGSNGQDPHRLRNLDISSAVSFGRWTPDGRYFVFQGEQQGHTDIWAVPERFGFLGRSMPPPKQLTNGPLSCSQPTPSRDGKQVFARCAKLRGELVRYDRHSQGFLPFLGGVSAHDVSYSRDAKWVVYVSYPDNILWRMRANGDERLQLTYPPMNVYMPAVFPDGTKVAFSMVEKRPWHEAGIYTVSLAGGELQKIVDRGLDPYWSPDGNSIVFSRYRLPLTSPQPMRGREIMIVNVKTGKISSVPQGQGKYLPLWTSQTTLVANWWDNSRIARYDFRTQTWSDLATGVYCSSTDSIYVYCETVAPAPATAKVVRVRISDGRLEPVADLKELRQIVGYGKDIGLAPNGELLFTRDASTQEIYALEVKWP